MAMTDPYVRSKQKRYKSTASHLEANRRYREKNREILNEKAKERMRRNSDEQLELIPARKRPAACTCGDIHNCLKCRNAERKRRTRAKDNNVLKRLAATMSPAVLAACLEVRALNASKRQAAQITAAATATGD